MTENKRLQTESEHSLEKSVYKRLQTRISNIILSNDYTETEVLALRVPKRIKLLYIALSSKEKRMFKEVFVSTLEGFVQQVLATRTNNVNVNVNVNVLQVQQKKGRRGSGEDTMLLREKLRMLEARLKDAKELVKYYKDRYEEAVKERDAAVNGVESLLRESANAVLQCLKLLEGDSYAKDVLRRLYRIFEERLEHVKKLKS